jgi:homoserine kinase type II
MLCGKPATLATRLPGRQHDAPSADDCAAVGRLLARMHLAATGFGAPAPPNPRGLDWWPRGAAEVADLLDGDADAGRLLDDEIATQQAFAASRAGRSLPHSAVHADLFRDNVLFDADGQPGAIDFYFACEDRWLFDLAVSCNDWCLADRWNAGDDEGPPLDATRLAALLAGYSTIRTPTPAEQAAFATMLRAAALRFWLSRLHDQARPRAARLLEAKDPRPFERLLRAHRSRPLRFDEAVQGATSTRP